MRCDIVSTLQARVLTHLPTVDFSTIAQWSLPNEDNNALPSIPDFSNSKMIEQTIENILTGATKSQTYHFQDYGKLISKNTVTGARKAF